MESEMLKQYLFIIAAIALSSCGTTRIINPNKPAGLSKISLTQNHKTQVTIANRRHFVVSQLQIMPESIR